MYYLGGRVLTRNETSGILRTNMEINGWTRVILNENSWSWTMPLRDDDVVLDVKLPRIGAKLNAVIPGVEPHLKLEQT
jgi:hypothetical protein